MPTRGLIYEAPASQLTTPPPPPPRTSPSGPPSPPSACPGEICSDGQAVVVWCWTVKAVVFCNNQFVVAGSGGQESLLSLDTASQAQLSARGTSQHSQDKSPVVRRVTDLISSLHSVQWCGDLTIIAVIKQQIIITQSQTQSLSSTDNSKIFSDWFEAMREMRKKVAMFAG